MNPTAFRNLVCGAISSTFLLSFSPVTRADALDNWTVTQINSNSFAVNRVVFGKGRYVAAGGQSDGGAIVTSEDGQNWVSRVNGGCCGPPALIWGLTYGQGRYVGVGHFGGTASSTDGINWSYGHVSTLGLYSVAYGAGRFVAVGEPRTTPPTSSIFHSTNGIDWQTGLQFPEEARTVSDVAFGAGMFVAIAQGGVTYISPDGIVWGRQNIPGGYKINYCKGIFIVPLGVGTNLISSDGIN